MDSCTYQLDGPLNVIKERSACGGWKKAGGK